MQSLFQFAINSISADIAPQTQYFSFFERKNRSGFLHLITGFFLNMYICLMHEKIKSNIISDGDGDGDGDENENENVANENRN